MQGIGGGMAASTSTLHIKPERATYWRSLAALLAIMVPVLVLLYVLTIPDGPWYAVLATQVIASVIWTILSFAFFAVEVRLDENSLVERRFVSGRHVISRDRVHTVLRLTGAESDAVAAHLFVCDADGNRLLRLRGYYWSTESMDALTKALDVPVEIIDESYSIGDLREGRPQLPYWYEGRPIMSSVIFAIGAGVLGVVLYGVLHLLDLVPS